MLEALRPSQFRALANELADGQKQKWFLKSVGEFLASVKLDGGAENDLVFVTSCKLSSARVWDVLAPRAAAEVLYNAPREAATIFLEGMPENYSIAVAAQISELKASDRSSKEYRGLIKRKLRVGMRPRRKKQKDTEEFLRRTGTVAFGHAIPTSQISSYRKFQAAKKAKSVVARKAKNLRNEILTGSVIDFENADQSSENLGTLRSE